jgi:hypothetical protein
MTIILEMCGSCVDIFEGFIFEQLEHKDGDEIGVPSCKLCVHLNIALQ